MDQEIPKRRPSKKKSRNQEIRALRQKIADRIPKLKHYEDRPAGGIWRDIEKYRARLSELGA